ncbi:MAG TPA: hypothetical protein VNB49_14675 [Candidatus Dormibacteraeota bacterium]|nr:hypothetical protein [Candidatus Dormibacteraeota bacterium]
MPDPTSVLKPAAPPPAAPNGALPPAAAAPAAEAAPAPAAEPSKPPPAREGALLADIRAREARMIQRENAMRQRESEVEARARMVQERDALAARDGLAYLKANGWTEEMIGQRLMNGNRPNPLDALEGVRREVAELREWKAQKERADAARDLESRRDRELEAFEKQAKGLKDTHPLATALATKNPKRLRAMGMRLATEDPTLTNEDILDRIQEELAEYAGLSGQKQATPAPSEAQSNSGSAAPPGTSVTLTSATADQRASLPPERKSVLKLSAEEQTAMALEAVRKARAAAMAKTS